MGQMANGRWQIMIHSAVGVPLHSKGLPRYCGPCPSARLSSYCDPFPPRADDDPCAGGARGIHDARRGQLFALALDDKGRSAPVTRAALLPCLDHKRSAT